MSVELQEQISRYFRHFGYPNEDFERLLCRNTS